MMNVLALAIGYTVMALAAWGVLGLVAGWLLRWSWDQAKAAGMLRDWAKWHRSDGAPK